MTTIEATRKSGENSCSMNSFVSDLATIWNKNSAIMQLLLF